jgi:type IV pilus assembly protein PilA
MSGGKLTRSESLPSGFSLIELLVVIAVILVIAAIAIPNFMRSRAAAYEASAVASLRDITTADTVYSSSYGIGYAATLAALGPPPAGTAVSGSNADLIDSLMAAGEKSGYIYTYTTSAPDSEGKIDTFQLNADPITSPFSGSRHFYTDQTGVIRQNLTGKAGTADPPVL